jgi:hypothetical protein
MTYIAILWVVTQCSILWVVTDVSDELAASIFEARLMLGCRKTIGI